MDLAMLRFMTGGLAHFYTAHDVHVANDVGPCIMTRFRIVRVRPQSNGYGSDREFLHAEKGIRQCPKPGHNQRRFRNYLLCAEFYFGGGVSAFLVFLGGFPASVF